MFINTAKKLCCILFNLDKGIADRTQVELVFRMHRDSIQFYSDNSEAQPSEKAYMAAIEQVKEYLGLKLTIEQITKILSLFPPARIKLAVNDSCFDSDTREEVLSSVSKYIVGAPLPKCGDEIDTDRFYEHLVKEAENFGFRAC